MEVLNPESKVVVQDALVEPSVTADPPGTRYQFERLGYFISDVLDFRPDRPVFNRIVTLRDTWAKRLEAREGRAEDETKGEAAGAGDEAAAGGVKGPRERRNTATETRERARRRDPELARREAVYELQLGLAEADADLLSGSRKLSDFFEEGLRLLEEGRTDFDREAEPFRSRAQSLANWMVNDLMRELKDRPLAELPVRPNHLVALVNLLEDGTVSQPVARELFQEVVTRGADPEALVKERGLEKVADAEALIPMVEGVLAAYADKVEAYRNGKTGLLGFFMGLVMRESQGKADPQVAKELLRERLGR